MANALKTLFTNCADAIRETLPDVGKMSPNSFPDRIREVAQSGGGSSDLVKYVTFMSWDGSTELFKMPVLSGDDCKDPITHGGIETPTKESTNTQVFTYSGWSLTIGGSANTSALKNVTEDRVVYASHIESVRYYTVNFYDGVTVSKTVKVTYGADATGLCELTKDGYQFKGWLPSVSNVTEDIDTYAQWIESVLFENASWDTIAEKSADGTASQMWSVGDKKAVTMSDGTTINVVIAGFNHDDLADGSGKAGITLLYDNVYGVSPMITATPSNYSGCPDNWGYSTLAIHSALETQKTSKLPSDLSKHIKPVLKKYYNNDLSGTSEEKTVATSNYMWLLSEKECGFKTSGTILNYEGEPYPLFTPNKENWDDCSELKRYDVSGNQRKWWIRTKTKTSKYWTAIDITGKKATTVGQSDSNVYILAGFCI